MWREWLSHVWTEINQTLTAAEAPQTFGLRDVNTFKVTVRRSYDSDRDMFHWHMAELWVNGKRRGGALEPFSAGIDMPVRVCLFADGFDLQLQEWPSVA